MKIATFGLDIQPGKYKYSDSVFNSLVEKFSPQKKTPFSVEFIGEDFEKCDAVVYNLARQFDFIFIDLEKIDKRLARASEAEEIALLRRLQPLLEEEKLLCDQQFTAEEDVLLKNSAFVTYKPCVGVEAVDDMSVLIKKIIDKAGVLIFFTAGKKEVRAWDINKGETIHTAAGRIHSDLARGFIKGEVVSCQELDNFYNMAEARVKGLVKLVDRDYVMQAGDIIEIKFNV